MIAVYTSDIQWYLQIQAQEKNQKRYAAIIKCNMAYIY